MTNTDDAITDLTTRVDRLEIAVRRATGLGLAARREALMAQRAHRTNIELLNALRKTQAEHSRVLDDHSRVLADHSRVLDEHTARFDSIEGTLGQVVVGMHNVESVLTRLVDVS